MAKKDNTDPCFKDHHKDIPSGGTDLSSPYMGVPPPPPPQRGQAILHDSHMGKNIGIKIMNLQMLCSNSNNLNFQ